MKVLIEGYSYPQADVINALPEDRIFFADADGKIKIDYVGYYRSPKINDFVFFLPKVLLEQHGGQDYVFCRWQDPIRRTGFISGLRPEEIIDLNLREDGTHEKLSKEAVGFLYEFAVWIYRSIAHFHQRHRDSGIIWEGHSQTAGVFKRRFVANTLLDVILALLRFNRDNQDYFRFKIKEKHSGLNKVNWTRTISKCTAFVQDDVPIYLELKNKRKVIDYDEELLVIFYSILAHVKRYGFDVKLNTGYELITGLKFERYLSGYGITRLKQIKYKYFSDRDLMLWELCYAFFSRAHQANVAQDHEEYLIAKNFEIVFESMIDELIGDEDLKEFKDLRDGKEIDHLYLDESLTRRAKSIYIADSKYYKLGNQLGEESIAKQFTYAKNLLQLNLDLFLPGDAATDKVKKMRRPFVEKGVGLMRDPITEGYDVIPNFFISARMDPDFNYDDPGLEIVRDPSRGDLSVHFENRLFDRDTLILARYNVNFLYVVKLYARNDAALRETWKSEVRGVFRKEIRDLIGNRFVFKAIRPHEGISPEQFFAENLKSTIGKVYSPFGASGDAPYYVLAVENPENMFEPGNLTRDGLDALHERLLRERCETEELIRSAFYVVDLTIGEDPSPALDQEQNEHKVVHAPAADTENGIQVVSHTFGPLLAAVRKTEWCPCSAAQCEDPDKVKILVLPHTQGANLFKVDSSVVIEKNLSENDIKNQPFGPDFSNVVFPSYPVHFWKVVPVH